MLVFTLLALVVLLGYQMFFKPKPAPPAQQQQQQSQPQAISPATPSGTPQAGPVASSALPAIAAAAVSETTVENANFRIVFTNQGAQVKHWILKNYQDSTGKPLDMVQAQAAARFGLPLSLFTYDAALTQQVNQALYQVTVDGAQPVGGVAHVPATKALSFHYSDGSVDVIKTVRFDETYVISVESQVRRNGALQRALLSWPAGLGDMEEFASGQGHNLPMSRTPSMFAWSIDGKQDSLAANKVSGNATLEQPTQPRSPSATPSTCPATQPIRTAPSARPTYWE